MTDDLWCEAIAAARNAVKDFNDMWVQMREIYPRENLAKEVKKILPKKKKNSL